LSHQEAQPLSPGGSLRGAIRGEAGRREREFTYYALVTRAAKRSSYRVGAVKNTHVQLP
jgi:hypothetical protein